jgi:ABC-type molybdate transport system permease subunit
MLIGVRSIAALPVIAGAVVIGLIAVGSLPPEPGHTVGKSTLDVTRAAFLVAAAPALILTAVLSVPLVGRALRRPLRRREERVRGAARAAEEAQEAAREAPKGAFSKGQKILIVLVSLSILGGIIFGGYELASSWWSWAQPSGPRPILQTT